MSANDPEWIARRRRSTASVKHVVEALWAVARAQKPRVEERVAESTTYLDWLDQTLDRIAGPPDESPTQVPLTVVLGPERAFCGSLSTRILQQLTAERHVILVGSRLAEAARAARIKLPTPLAEVQGPSSVSELEAATARTTEAILQYAAGRAVELLYATSSTLSLHRSILIAGTRELRQVTPELLSPQREVLRRLIEEAVSGRVGAALAETLLLELTTRLQVLETARRNADEKLKELSLAWQLARQEQITNELNELVAARFSAEP